MSVWRPRAGRGRRTAADEWARAALRMPVSRALAIASMAVGSCLVSAVAARAMAMALSAVWPC